MSLDNTFNITLDSNDATFNILGDEKLRLTSLGNVGIGNNIPETALDVIGTIRINGGNTSSDYLGTPGLTLNGFIYTTGLVNNPETGSAPAAITFGNGSTLGNDQISLVTGGNTRMYIDPNGNVGIGTTSPSSKLDVNGDITASTVNANLTGNVTGNVSGSSGSVSGSVSADSLTCNGNVNFRRNYNSYFVKLGIDGGYGSNPIGKLYFVNNSDNNNNITVFAAGFDTSSDDRLKTNEVLITNATNTIMKLSPQIYEKYRNVEHTKGSWTESGLIAQDVWYNTPELRHIVSLPIDASGNESVPLPLPEGVNTQQNIQQDIDYVSLGWSSNDTASLNYSQIIPYLIKSNQEQQEEINTLKTQLTDVLNRLSASENN